MKIEKYPTGEKVILHIGHIESEYQIAEAPYAVWGPESEDGECYNVVGYGTNLQEVMAEHGLGMESVYAACQCDGSSVYPLGIKSRKIYKRRVKGKLTGETLTRETIIPLGTYTE